MGQRIWNLQPWEDNSGLHLSTAAPIVGALGLMACDVSDLNILFILFYRRGSKPSVLIFFSHVICYRVNPVEPLGSLAGWRLLLVERLVHSWTTALGSCGPLLSGSVETPSLWHAPVSNMDIDYMYTFYP